MGRLSLFLLLTACTRPNQLYDEPTASSESTATGASVAATTTPTTSGTTAPTTTAAGQTGSDTGTTTTSGTTTDALTTAATTTATTLATSTTTTTDATTTGTTGADCPPCDDCFTCVDGLCVQAPADTLCAAPVGLPCEQTIHGKVDDGVIVTCHAYAHVPATCNGQGICRYPCAEQGEAVVTCDKVCVLPVDNCLADTPVAAVATDTMCYTATPSPGCQPVCEITQVEGKYSDKFCDPTGVCIATPTESCGFFKCSDTGCFEMCAGKAQCVAAADCNGNNICVFQP